jgi:hypothetical protein
VSDTVSGPTFERNAFKNARCRRRLGLDLRRRRQ